MPTIETDSEPHWVKKVWETKKGDLRLRDALKKPHRSMAGVVLVAFAMTGIMLAVAVDTAAGGDLVGAALASGFTVAAGWLALDSLDILDCELREGHECRKCRKETARWEADKNEEDR